MPNPRRPLAIRPIPTQVGRRAVAVILSATALVLGARHAPVGPLAAQPPVNIAFSNGRVSLTAQNATLGEILAEWSRQGGTRIENVDGLAGGRITLDLSDVPERHALDVVLREAVGYVVTARPMGEAIGRRSAFASVVLARASGEASVAAVDWAPTRSAPEPADGVLEGGVMHAPARASASSDGTEANVPGLKIEGARVEVVASRREVPHASSQEGEGVTVEGSTVTLQPLRNRPTTAAPDHGDEIVDGATVRRPGTRR